MENGIFRFVPASDSTEADILPPILRLSGWQIALGNRLAIQQRTKRDHQDAVKGFSDGRTVDQQIEDTRTAMVMGAIQEAPARIAEASGGDPELTDELTQQFMEAMDTQVERKMAPLKSPTPESLAIGLIAGLLNPRGAGSYLALPFESQMLAQRIQQEQFDQEFALAQKAHEDRLQNLGFLIQQARLTEQHRDDEAYRQRLIEIEDRKLDATEKERERRELEERNKERQRQRQIRYNLHDAYLEAGPADMDSIVERWREMFELGDVDLPPPSADVVAADKAYRREVMLHASLKTELPKVFNANSPAEFVALRVALAESTAIGDGKSLSEEKYGSILDARHQELVDAQKKGIEPRPAFKSAIAAMNQDLSRVNNSISGLESEIRKADADAVSGATLYYTIEKQVADQRKRVEQVGRAFALAPDKSKAQQAAKEILIREQAQLDRLENQLLAAKQKNMDGIARGNHARKRLEDLITERDHLRAGLRALEERAAQPEEVERVVVQPDGSVKRVNPNQPSRGGVNREAGAISIREGVNVSGLTPKMQTALGAFAQAFPGQATIISAKDDRPKNPKSRHPHGDAIDITLRDWKQADSVVKWLLDNGPLYEINQVIWKQQNWKWEGGKWVSKNPVPGHDDHIHVGRNPAAYRK